jgi:methylenetetrahydrofolate dehydrogenase (NADP+) / methenyltetrahydrofolate cyclohydrolase
MTGATIDGVAYAGDLKAATARLITEVQEQGVHVGLATVMVGDDYAAAAYERRLRHLAEELGCAYRCERMPASVSEAEAVARVGLLDADPRVSGILVLRPLPPHVCEVALYRALDPLKDIESMHPVNAGLLALGRPRYVPSTPASVFHLLDRYLISTGRDPDEFYRRSRLVVVGRSLNVGKPAVLLGLGRGATVIACDEHTSRSGYLHECTRQADILVSAAGVPGLLGGEHVKPGVIAVDVGINPVTDPVSGRTRLVGDLVFDEIREVAEAVSPVPGGVGPITDVCLLHTTAAAARLTAEQAAAEIRCETADLPTPFPVGR